MITLMGSIAADSGHALALVGNDLLEDATQVL